MLYFALAVLPAMLLLLWLYTRERDRPLSKRSVYRLYLLGAAIVLPAGLIERKILDTNSGFSQDGLPVLIMTAFFVAGMVEEFLKAAIVDRSAFRTGLMVRPVDAMVYCGAVALGFATIENILYVTSAGFSTALLRSVTAVPAHLMFGLVMGVNFIRAKWFNGNVAYAYLVPAFAHGVYDTFALSNSVLGDVGLLIYLIVLLEITLRRLDWARKIQTKTLGPVHRMS